MTFGSASLQEDSGHPNKMNFRGVLVRVDEPSTKPPGGANGHRILVPSALAKKRLKTLINMGLNYSPSLDTHAQKRKVGTIVKAWIDGKDLWVEAVIWKHDFPEAETDLKQSGLGMSMEIGDVQVDNEAADIWKLSDFCFLGATILWKNSAAYYRTQAIAANKEGSKHMAKVNTGGKRSTTTQKVDTGKIAEIAAAAASVAVSKALAPTIGRQSKILASMATRLDDIELKLAGKVITTEADDAADDVDDEDVTAGAEKHKAGCSDKECEGCMESKAADKEDDDDDDDDDEDEEDIDAEDINKGDLEEMGPDTDDDEEDDDEPGAMNKGAKNKGRKAASEDKVGKTVASARIANALKQNKKLAAQVGALSEQVAQLKKQSRRQAKQMAAAGAERRSVDPSTLSLLSRSGISVGDLQASGTKLTVAEVDAVLAASGVSLGPVERMTAKNNLLQSGLMEDGVVTRAR